jgi:hypothetical protein
MGLLGGRDGVKARFNLILADVKVVSVCRTSDKDLPHVPACCHCTAIAPNSLASRLPPPFLLIFAGRVVDNDCAMSNAVRRMQFDFGCASKGSIALAL